MRSKPSNPARTTTVIGGLVAGALLAWAALRQLASERTATGLIFTPRRTGQRQSLESLRRAILGVRKPMLVEAFGPPRASVASSVPERTDSAYWETDTWYYSLDPAQKAALAVHFVEGVARRVEFIRAPAGA